MLLRGEQGRKCCPGRTGGLPTDGCLLRVRTQLKAGPAARDAAHSRARAGEPRDGSDNHARRTVQGGCGGGGA